MKLLAIIDPWSDELTISPKTADLWNRSLRCRWQDMLLRADRGRRHCCSEHPVARAIAILAVYRVPPLGHQPGFR
jgi:hypothetical protein